MEEAPRPGAPPSTDVQPQFSTSMPRARTDAAARMNDEQEARDDGRRLALPDPAMSRSPATASTQGRMTATRFEPTGPPHLPLVDDLGEGRGMRDLVEARVEEVRAEAEAEDE